MVPSSPSSADLPSSGETTPIGKPTSLEPVKDLTSAMRISLDRGRGTPLRSFSTPASGHTEHDDIVSHVRRSFAEGSESDADTGNQTPKPFKPSLIRSGTSTSTVIRIPSQSAPPSRIGSRRPSDNASHVDNAAENGRVNADDLFEKEEDREARTQSDDFYKEFCE
jgi:hypothetical protein